MSINSLNYTGVAICVLVLSLFGFCARAEGVAQSVDQAVSAAEKHELSTDEALAFVTEVNEGMAAADLEIGAVVYEDNCAACHGYDGVNLLPEAPNFTDPNAFKKANTDLFLSIRDGRGDIMPPWNEELNAVEMFSALAFAKQFAPKQKGEPAEARE